MVLERSYFCSVIMCRNPVIKLYKIYWKGEYHGKVNNHEETCDVGSFSAPVLPISSVLFFNSVLISLSVRTVYFL